MTSLRISELSGVAHKNVMRKLRELEPDWLKAGGLKFEPTSFTDNWNRKQPMYILDYDQTMYIAATFDNYTRAIIVLELSALKKKLAAIEEKRGLKKTLKQASKELEKYFTITDRNLLAKQTRVNPYYVYQVSIGEVHDPAMASLIQQRIERNRKYYRVFYTLEGAQSVLEFNRTGNPTKMLEIFNREEVSHD